EADPPRARSRPVSWGRTHSLDDVARLPRVGGLAPSGAGRRKERVVSRTGERGKGSGGGGGCASASAGALGWRLTFLRYPTARRLGYHSVGAAQIVKAHVVSRTSTEAQVQACVYDGVVAYQKDGSPAPGNAGKATYGVNQATLVPAGPQTWAVKDGSSQQFG